MATKYQTKVRNVGTWTLGTNLAGGVESKIDIGALVPPFIDVGNKSVLVRLRFKVSATLTTNGSSPAVPHRYFRYLLDARMTGPGNYPIMGSESLPMRGWTFPHFAYLQRGFVDDIRGADFPINTASGQRTWSQGFDFEEPNSLFPLQRCYAIEAFKAGNAGCWITLRTAATIKGTAITVTAATVQVLAEVVDVSAREVPIPVPVTRYMLQSDNGAINPSPGPGKYLRILMANSPVAGDNLGDVALDDLASYTQIDSFGYPTKESVHAESVERLLERTMRAISVERPSPSASPSGNSSLFRLYDPLQNSDGLTLGIPLVVPSKGSNLIREAPLFADFPRLHANGESRAGLPGGFWFLVERVDARTGPLLNAYVGALTDANGKPILGRNARPADGGDPSRAPLIINAS